MRTPAHLRRRCTLRVLALVIHAHLAQDAHSVRARRGRHERSTLVAHALPRSLAKSLLSALRRRGQERWHWWSSIHDLHGADSLDGIHQALGGSSDLHGAEPLDGTQQLLGGPATYASGGSINVTRSLFQDVIFFTQA